jgi:nucleoside-diphosphate-sugar epimerase
MRVAITGSSGFIGGHLKQRLTNEGHKIVEWDTNIDRPIESFKTDRVDYVVHLAAYADVRASIDDPDKYWENNVINTTRIQRMCHKENIPLLYASSSCIHNWWLSPYGVSKKVNEETAYDRQVGLRFTTVYGEGARDTMLIGRLVSGNIRYLTEHVRDFVHVSDVVNAICILMSYDIGELKPAYDIGTGKGNVVATLGEIAGYGHLPIMSGDVCEAQDNTADITDMSKLGWKPTVDVKEFLHQICLDGIPV